MKIIGKILKVIVKILKVIAMLFTTTVVFEYLNDLLPDNWRDIEERLSTKPAYADLNKTLNECGYVDAEDRKFLVKVFKIVRWLYKTMFTWAIWF